MPEQRPCHCWSSEKNRNFPQLSRNFSRARSNSLWRLCIHGKAATEGKAEVGRRKVEESREPGRKPAGSSEEKSGAGLLSELRIKGMLLVVFRLPAPGSRLLFLASEVMVETLLEVLYKAAAFTSPVGVVVAWGEDTWP
jgi:hypothetical protein